MSGIYGYIQREKNDTDYMSPLYKWHADYGREARDQVVLGNVGLGCALKHFRKDVEADSPILQVDNVYAVVDALLYNRDELIDKLASDDARKMSDERMLLEIYLRFGAEGLREVNGDFTGAVYDGVNLVLFRDHMGIRPLFWYQDDQLIAFGTDMRGIMALPGINKAINEEYLYANLSGYLMDESEITDFQYVKMLKHGSVLTIDAQLNTTMKRFWRIGEKKIRFKTEQEYIDRMRELVYDSIKRRLAVTGGENVGAELSGGMDSSVIDVIIKELGTDPLCFSWSPSLSETPMQHHDEREIIEKTCEQFNLNCTYGFQDITELESQNMEEKLLFPPDKYNSFVTSTAKFFGEKNIPVVFSGWGGDEGVSHRNTLYELWYSGEKWQYLKIQWQRFRGKKKIFRVAKAIFRNLTRDRKMLLTPWNLYKANGMMIPDILNDHFKQQWNTQAKLIANAFSYDSIMHIDQGANRGRIETCAITSAMYETQFVFPFLDYRVEDYAVSIPRSLFINVKEGFRYIYKKSFKEQMIPELYSYVYKDDPGRVRAMDDSYRSAESLGQSIHSIIQKLDQRVWSSYISLGKVLKSFSTLPDYDKYFYEQMLHRCLQIQLIIKINDPS